MNDQREWETAWHPGRTIGPLHPRVVTYTWGRVLAQGVSVERLGAYALAGGRTVYLGGPHPEAGPRGFRIEDGRVSLEGADERGQPVRLHGLLPASVDVYLCVSGRP